MLPFNARRYASTTCADVVCPSVSLTHAGIVSKRLNTGSRRQRHTIDQGRCFSGAKDLGEIRTESPTMGRQMQAGKVKIGDFWQITYCNSKTLQDRRIVSIKVEEEIAGALLNGDIARDLGLT